MTKVFVNTSGTVSVLASEEDARDFRLRMDDEAEFTALVEREARFVFRIAYSLLRNPEDAEDAVQEMFFNLYRRRAWIGLRDERAFLARAVWRSSLDKWRQRATLRQEPEREETPTLAPDPERQAVDADWRKRVHALVDTLPEELRQPLALSSVEEMNSREIGAVMGIAEGTVRTRLLRARQLLRAKIAAMEKGQHARSRG